MAYMSQERKSEIAKNLKTLLAGSGLKYTLRVRNHSTLIMTIKSGPVDFFGDLNLESLARGYACRDEPDTIAAAKVQVNKLRAEGYLNVNVYWLHEHYDGHSRELLMSIRDVMNRGNHDRSDIQSDYFDVGWYIEINIGDWRKPYIQT